MHGSRTDLKSVGPLLPTLTAGQLVLEPLTAAHAEQMFEVLADREIYRHLDYSPPPSVEHLRDVYTRLESRRSPDGSQLWLNWVVRVNGRAPAGYVQATVISPRSAWIAYVLSSKYWGFGHAHAATRAMIDHLAAAYGIDRYLATVEVGNRRSIRLLERLDFRSATSHEARTYVLSATERLFVRGSEHAQASDGLKETTT